ncbi:MAG TPA: hypothetical protein VFG15_18875 [Amycolatopsis sp.]|nr:hypothetical protein [Amycolatopsis sp.]
MTKNVTRETRPGDGRDRSPRHRNEDQEGRLFDTVAGAVERHAPGIQIVRPGLVAVPIAGAAVYAGGEAALAEQLIDDVSAAAGVEAVAGAADGLFAAILAARRGTLVDPGRSRDFLAPLSLAELDEPGSGRADLVGLLHRFGLRTIRDFAQLLERDVTARFGRAGTLAHRLARGLDEHPPTRRTPARPRRRAILRR